MQYYQQSVVQTEELNAWWKMIYQKIFGFSKSESVFSFHLWYGSIELQAHYCCGPCQAL